VGRPRARWRDEVGKDQGCWDEGVGGQQPWIEKSGGNFWRRLRLSVSCSADDDDDICMEYSTNVIVSRTKSDNEYFTLKAQKRRHGCLVTYVRWVMHACVVHRHALTHC
jgi:hypothetical protein